ncbi:MAG: arsenic resistance protein [Candidatus Woesearchaeota archaeon]
MVVVNSNIIQLILLFSAVIIGSVFGIFQIQIASEFILDIAIIALVFSVFLQIPLKNFISLNKIVSYKKYISIAWMLNFIFIPTIAFVLALLFFDRESAIFLGILIYLIAPCTDWVLGFTKKCEGDEVANSLLLPINLFSQIILLPIYLLLFVGVETFPQVDILFETLIIWIIFPLFLAQFCRFIINKYSKNNSLIDKYSPIMMDISLIILIIQIFSLNIEVLLEYSSSIPLILLVIFIFFIVIYYLVKMISKFFKLSQNLEKSLTMTTAARNAPLMFAVSLVLFPEMVLIHSVIIIGMLLEFPHLILLSHILSED